ncbi:hypothetical protein AF335_28720 [Streptomyces eurocidicus]|uniref:Uncharacterized protein n=1 Tax=Streptomyces eurocidicus TaxID=66423 RepID=A0A2N8NPQ2_STREU|nr:hypothetical protein [Streptomyces eurocidicus]MBB5119489.1 hypothetical protein [Streptomyces eurocidicus]MBF6054360.1 hypothetical protein [Streptomyces eurocidicus]PNE30752.1 hypothetical protein AF335_28720 [Streptomyces eurocidicus]
MRNPIPALIARARARFTRRTPAVHPHTTPAPLYVAAGAHGFNLISHAPSLPAPCNCPEATQLSVPRALIGDLVVDTVAGGSGRVVEVEPSGLALVQHPNGLTWRSCTLRPAGAVERLNLLAADAVHAGRE